MLLRPIEGPGWPRDYLLARVRGALAPPGERHDDPWPALLAAGRRLYPVLDPAWRREFAPVVALLEVRALASALRLRQGGDADRAAAPLRGSLLRSDLLDTALRDAVQLPPLLDLPPQADPRVVEAALLDRELHRGRTLCREPALCLFFERLIDLRNLLALLKALRWGTAEPPRLLTGGDVPVPRWENAWRQRSLQPLHQRLARLAPGTAGELPARLLADLGARLARRARDPLDAAVVLRYGWRLRLPADAPGGAA